MSAITPQVANARGYRSVTKKAELGRFGFSDYQRRTPTLLLPVWNVYGEIATYQIRPDDPRIGRDGEAVKYESPGGARMVLDVPPAIREMLKDPSKPLYITEGLRKADAAVSIGLCCVAVLGVYGWRGTNEQGGRAALPCWESIPLAGRMVYLAFDSDITQKRSVYAALQRLAAFLKSQNAQLRFIYFPPGPHGEKVAIDDYIFDGHRDVAEINALASDTLIGPHAADQEGARRAGAMLEDVPLPKLVVPEPYSLSAKATLITRTRRNEAGQQEEVRDVIAHAPLLLGTRLNDIDEHTVSQEVLWKRPSGWVHDIIPREHLLDARQLVPHASRDFPVSSDTSKHLVKYFQELEAANYKRIPTARVSSHLGWQGKDGRLGFLVGRSLVTKKAILPPPAIDKLGRLKCNPRRVLFRGAAPGDEQLAGAYKAAGSFDEWLNVISELRGHPRALIVFYAAFVPPLLPILGVPNFIVETANETSTGKTTSLRAGASVWGLPDEHHPDAAIRTWDATPVAIERMCGVLTGLPLILDETKRAIRPEHVWKTMYLVSSGQCRSRGNKPGLALTKTFHTVLLSSGEAPSTALSQDGGTRTRVIEILGHPFGNADAETRDLVDRINLGLLSNYGHAGPKFVHWLLQARKRWPEFIELYKQRLAHLLKKTTSPEAGRLAKYFAAIQTAATLARRALGKRLPRTTVLATLWSEVARGGKDAVGARRALLDVMSWAESNKNRFEGYTLYRASFASTLGKWHLLDELDEKWDWIAFYPPPLEEFLLGRGYQPPAIYAAWKHRGWLVCDGDRFSTKKYRLRGAPKRMIVITREAVRDAQE